MIAVRRAAVEDAPAVGRAHAASWRGAYEHLGEAFLETIVDQERIDLWTRVIAEDDGVALVAPADDPCAFIYLGPSRDDDAAAHVGEVFSFYARPESWGTGLGRALMEAGVAELRVMGFTEATLWVLKENPRARRFYEIAGWSTDGATKQQFWRGVVLDEVRYHRRLDV